VQLAKFTDHPYLGDGDIPGVLGQRCRVSGHDAYEVVSKEAECSYSYDQSRN
jgi:hypothetical protein